MRITGREHLAPNGVLCGNHDQDPNGDDGTWPRNEARRIGPRPGGAVEPRMLMLVFVIRRRKRGTRLVSGHRDVGALVIACVLVLAMMRFPVREGPAGSGERDEQSESAGGQPEGERARH